MASYITPASPGWNRTPHIVEAGGRGNVEATSQTNEHNGSLRHSADQIWWFRGARVTLVGQSQQQKVPPAHRPPRIDRLLASCTSFAGTSPPPGVAVRRLVLVVP
ncbi:hypothetical protein OPV22_016418 [Ensete ventricosum]|uniref:Uncharacterized protein n=1 Tax=Ensete ventricosum TaxID=4639 RepID=A0AAV8QZW5_ENSVE|nr:hypothetical protein OPV22_016418 [Ensete ventricosum]